MIKRYGVPFAPEESTANDEALEGSAGLSATGGIESDGSWDDEVEEMNFNESQSVEEDEESSIVVSAEDIYEQDNSLEDIAGIDVSSSEPSTEDVSAMFEDKENIESEDKPSKPHQFLQRVSPKDGLWTSGNGMVMNGLLRIVIIDHRQTIGSESFNSLSSFPL